MVPPMRVLPVPTTVNVMVATVFKPLELHSELGMLPHAPARSTWLTGSFVVQSKEEPRVGHMHIYVTPDPSDPTPCRSVPLGPCSNVQLVSGASPSGSPPHHSVVVLAHSL